MTNNSTKNSSENPWGGSQHLGTLVNALAQKGTAGIILLAIIFLPIWTPVGLIFHWYFKFIGTAEDFAAVFTTGPLLASVIFGILCISYISAACFLTLKIIGAMVPVIKAEGEVARKMSQALGGRVVTPTGTWEFTDILIKSAEDRAKQIMRRMLEHAQAVMQVELIRANIFTLREDDNLKILDDFYLNMEGVMVTEDELDISIPDGFLTSGWAHKYFEPAVHLKMEDRWPRAIDENIQSKLDNELQKVHKDLKWVMSMPIPYRVKPFPLVCGVLNIDGLGKVSPSVEQAKKLLADLSTAANLISVLNRGTGFLKGIYRMPGKKPDHKVEEQVKHVILEIDLKEFDPAKCPEPSKDFILALSNIQGLEFFANLSPTEVASFLRQQLYS